MNAENSRACFALLAQAIPQPTTELQYQSPFELLIAVVLSAKATDKSVNKATAALFPVANTPQGLLALGEDGLKPFIRHIGLYNSKAAHIIQLCQQLITLYNGDVPNTRQQLQTLAGVGRKTANVILNTAFGQPTIAVDTHVFRVANRIGLAAGKTVLAVELQLEKIIPPEYAQDAHHLLILHGRYTCTARKPHCEACVLRDCCEYHKSCDTHSRFSPAGR